MQGGLTGRARVRAEKRNIQGVGENQAAARVGHGALGVFGAGVFGKAPLIYIILGGT